MGLEEFVTKHGNTVESDYARRVLMDEVGEKYAGELYYTSWMGSLM